MLGPYKDIHSATITASADIKDSQAVGYDDGPAGTNTRVQGVAHYDQVAGKNLAIMQKGELPMRAGAALGKGVDVISNVDGNPVPVGATENPEIFGRTQEAAANPGDLVLIQLV